MALSKFVHPYSDIHGDAAIQNIAGISHGDDDVWLFQLVAEDEHFCTHIYSALDCSKIVVAGYRSGYSFVDLAQRQAVSPLAFAYSTALEKPAPPFSHPTLFVHVSSLYF